ncbi:hypothetical protein [Psychrobacillus sp. OK032]|uniref:hypothetical protein n=1 Tax=Psychrobacillus sp. OK032 TaxID=1884358 RepID=UPI0015A4F4D4|nr:hypothetical protein [Psychrobacillus sp. OK032]
MTSGFKEGLNKSISGSLLAVMNVGSEYGLDVISGVYSRTFVLGLLLIGMA